MAKEIPQEPGESSRADWRDPTNYKSLLTLDRSGWAWKWLRRNPDYIARTAQLLTRPRLGQPGARLRVITTSDAEEAGDWGLHFRGGAKPPGNRCLPLLARRQLCRAHVRKNVGTEDVVSG